jgi:hypothetical protein
MFGCIDIYSRRSWQLFSAKSVEDPSYDYQEESARDVRQHGAPTARPFLPEHMLTLVRRLAYNDDVVGFEIGRRQGGPSRTGV